MVSQQFVAPPAHAAMFLVLTINPGAHDQVRDVLADATSLVRSVTFRVLDAHLNAVVGIGAHAWDRLYAAPRPAGLHPLPQFAGAKHHAPSTPGDLLIHLRCRRQDLCFELARQFMARLGALTTVVDEVHGFKYFDERDLLGFVDGTENPEGSAAQLAVVIAEDDPAYAGGSYVAVQKYLHNLQAWQALSVQEQERVIGRSKSDDIEMPDQIKPSTPMWR